MILATYTILTMLSGSHRKGGNVHEVTIPCNDCSIAPPSLPRRRRCVRTSQDHNLRPNVQSVTDCSGHCNIYSRSTLGRACKSEHEGRRSSGRTHTSKTAVRLVSPGYTTLSITVCSNLWLWFSLDFWACNMLSIKISARR